MRSKGRELRAERSQNYRSACIEEFTTETQRAVFVLHARGAYSGRAHVEYKIWASLKPNACHPEPLCGEGPRRCCGFHRPQQIQQKILVEVRAYSICAADILGAPRLRLGMTVGKGEVRITSYEVQTTTMGELLLRHSQPRDDLFDVTLLEQSNTSHASRSGLEDIRSIQLRDSA